MTESEARDSYQKINSAQECGPSGCSSDSGVAVLGFAVRSLGPYNRFVWIKTYQAYHHSIEANRNFTLCGFEVLEGR
jgi:hypothetical protein